MFPDFVFLNFLNTLDKIMFSLIIITYIVLICGTLALGLGIYFGCHIHVLQTS